MTDQELDQVLSFTKGIPQERRAVFLETLGHMLSTSGDCGPHIVSRALLSAQRDVVGVRLATTFLVRG
jgi:hypothetical protein